MSSAAHPLVKEHAAKNYRWGLWAKQIGGILRLEARKNFFSKRAVLIYLLALLPVLLLTAFAFVMSLQSLDAREVRDFQQNSQVVFAIIYQTLILFTTTYFGCAWIFMNLFRGEVIDRSLHYYFLVPVRREILVIGKYFAGLLASIILFSLTTLISYLLFSSVRTSTAQYLYQVASLGQASAYLSITVLACLGYGAIFLIIGLFFRNPIIPALLVYGWEVINFLLPPLLKKISIIHYLQSLSPVPTPEGPFAIVTTPTPAYISIPGLLLLTAFTILLASLRIRRMEISYAGD